MMSSGECNYERLAMIKTANERFCMTCTISFDKTNCDLFHLTTFHIPSISSFHIKRYVLYNKTFFYSMKIQRNFAQAATTKERNTKKKESDSS